MGATLTAQKWLIFRAKILNILNQRTYWDVRPLKMKSTHELQTYVEGITVVIDSLSKSGTN